MKLENSGDNYTVMGRLYIKGDNKYGENNITQVHYNVDDQRLYILLKYRKAIQIYNVVFQQQDSTKRNGELPIDLKEKELELEENTTFSLAY